MFIWKETLRELQSELSFAQYMQKEIQKELDAHLEEHKKPIKARMIEVVYEIFEKNIQTDIYRGTGWGYENGRVTIYDNRDPVATLWNSISVRFVKGEPEETA